MKKLIFFTFLIFNGALAGDLSAVAVKNQTDLKDNVQTVWIYFHDKGPDAGKVLQRASGLISEKAFERRAKVLPINEIISLDDLPVHEPYITALDGFVQKIRIRSRWLNAVSAEVDSGQLDTIRTLHFIQEIELVRRFRRSRPNDDDITQTPSRSLHKVGDLDYGSSLAQLAQINVPPLHRRGVRGDDVLICLLDNGFYGWKEHAAFDSTNVVATYDFINDDPEVDDRTYPGEGTHGTQTLSAIAAYAPGKLIGPAFGSSYMLGKTEIGDQEIQIEEDHWVAGIEWAERQGADIVSSSLGYIDWYDWSDMDGRTALTTRHADMAVERGMLVFNSAGNDGRDEKPNTLIAPADGRYVLAVGAVDFNNRRAAFSSYGPTADGRNKPDLAAPGVGVKVASPANPDGFTTGNGTSFSCPLAAGAAALLLSAHPGLTPAQITQALKQTASQADKPDNLLGWGIVNAGAADAYLSGKYGGEYATTFELDQNYPNPFNSFTVITYRIPSSSEVSIDIYDIRGRKIRELEKRIESLHGSRLLTTENIASGVYFYRMAARELATGRRFSATKKMVVVK